MTKIIETGIIISDVKDSPVFECVAFQQISYCDSKGKWHNTGLEVFQYCILEDIDPDQKVNLPCLRNGRCIWKGIIKKRGLLLRSAPLDEVQMTFDLEPKVKKP